MPNRFQASLLVFFSFFLMGTSLKLKILLYLFCYSLSREIATRSPHGLESDVWSLGCMLYTLVVGQPPFDVSLKKQFFSRQGTVGG